MITELEELEIGNADYYGDREYFDYEVPALIGVNDGCHIYVLDKIVAINHQIISRSYQISIEGSIHHVDDMKSFLHRLRHLRTL